MPLPIPSPLRAALALIGSALLLAACSSVPPSSGGTGPQAEAGTAPPAPPPPQIAVLLPQKGRYAQAGQAVRTGILAAQGASAQGTPTPKLRFYDTQNPAAVPDLLRQAAAEGANLAIGPLEKEAVDALALQPALPIPTLALNHAIGGGTPPNLYQYALDPEDEAADAARKAWGQAYRSAILLYPANPWGERLAEGYRREWLSRGGHLVATHAFDPDHADLPPGLLEDAFAGSVHGAPADCVLLVATTTQARQLWPGLLANAKGVPPVFATSHVYEGAQDPEANQALIGLQFVDIPWMIDNDPADPLSRHQLQRTSGGLDPRLSRLYAMGMDAYALSLSLTGLSGRPGAYLEGRTGRLSLDPQRRVQRELILARMDSLGPTRLGQTGARKAGPSPALPPSPPATAPTPASGPAAMPRASAPTSPAVVTPTTSGVPGLAPASPATSPPTASGDPRLAPARL